MKEVITKLHIGLAKPITILQISDTHLTLCDERDNARKAALAAHRATIFPGADEFLGEVEVLAKREGHLLVHTGDLSDFVSAANLDRAAQLVNACDVMMVAGNHEFSQYVGEAVEDAAYRNVSLDRVQAVYHNDIRFTSRVVGGVNLVGIDNGYYLFDKEQLDALKCEVAKGLPILLFLHVPLYSEALYDHCLAIGKTSAYLTAVPDEKTECYPPDRRAQQTADNITREMVAYIEAEPLIQAVFAGHLHHDFTCTVGGRLPQYVTGMDTVRRIETL